MVYHKLHGRIDFQGLPISVENPKGGKRYWTDEETGETGVTVMEYPYGYVKGTLGTDGDEVDVYVGPNKSSDKVFVITQQKKPDVGYTGQKPWVEVDEQKVMLGFNSAKEAQECYMRHFNDTRFFGTVIELTVESFKDRLKSHYGKLIKGLNAGLRPAIMIEDNIRMLILPESDVNKAFKPQELKPGGEEATKSRMVDTDGDGDIDEDDAAAQPSMKSRKEAIAALHKAQACAAMSEKDMDMKKKFKPKEQAKYTHAEAECDDVPVGAADKDDLKVKKSMDDVDLTKALRAIAVASMTRRQRLDAAYHLGVAQGRQTPRVQPEPVQLSNLNIGVNTTRPMYEPPVVPIRRVETPTAEMRPGAETSSCVVHGYVHKSDVPCPICEKSNVGEATPFWRR